MSTNQGMGALMATVFLFQDERPIFLREYANKMYSVPTYYLAKVLADTPVLTLAPLVFSLIVYFKIGLTISVSQYFCFYLILLMMVYSASGFGYVISSIFSEGDTAAAMAPLI